MQLELERWTREREVMLVQLIEAGGPEGKEARDAFIVENIPLVRSRVFRMVPFLDREIVDDLISEAMPALIRAVDKFDWRRETPFASYAVVGIDGALKDRFTRDTKYRSLFNEGR